MIGLLDTGLDLNHSEFSHAFKQTLVCGAWNGIEFAHVNPASQGDLSPTGHGTAMAALIGGRTVGVVPDCRLAVCAVDPKTPSTRATLITTEALYWLADQAFNGVMPQVIVTCLAHAAEDHLLWQTVDEIVNVRGIVLVAVTGEKSFGSSVWFPAAASHAPVISVGASDRGNQPWTEAVFDSTNPIIGAPGVHVVAPGMPVPGMPVPGMPQQSYTLRSGSCPASAIAGGVIARLLQASPAATYSPFKVAAWFGRNSHLSKQPVVAGTACAALGAGVVTLAGWP